ncbi:Type IV pilus assembly protein PilP [Candidatus Electrothrix aarhusensis]|jgi:type IV pilus assembly protein PilP
MKLLIKVYIWSLPLLFICWPVNGKIWAAGSEAVSQDAQSGEEQEIREVDKFQYKFEDRPDPFFPFLSKDTGRDPDGDLPIDDDEGKPLTGMQLFEPGQLKLVALLKIGNKNVAMVEDVGGKGYRLDENMLIGRHGVINRIKDEQVEITESYKTKTGRIVTKEITMRMKKEGDK